MYGTHKTKEGETMNICEMDDNHLVNTINLILSRIEMAKKALRNELESDDFKASLISQRIRHFDKDDLTRIVRETTVNLCLYVSEAALRGITLSAKLQKTFEREGVVVIDKSNMLLIASDEDEDECEDGEF